MSDLFPIPSGRGRWRLTLHERQFADTPWSSTVITELSQARSRQLVQAINTAAVLTFTLDGRQAPAAGLIEELTQDVVAWRWDEYSGRDVPYFRGLITHSEDELSEDTHTVTFTCHDYLAMLDRRFTTTALNITGQDQDNIAATFAELAVDVTSSTGATNFSPGSYLPLSPLRVNPDGSGRALSTVLRDRTYTAASQLSQLLDDLAHVIGGFDYDAVPGWRFDGDPTTDFLRIFYPIQGIDRSSQMVLEYGGTVSSLTRNIDSSVYANYEWLIGSPPTGSAADAPPLFGEVWNADANDVTRVPLGLWMNTDNASDVVLQSTLTEQAQGNLALMGIVVPQYTVVLRPGYYCEGLCQMGDTVPLIVRSGRLNVTDAQRIMGIEFDIGDDGQEDVSLTLARSPFTLIDLIRAGSADINALARR